jgi:hypothetical protein
VQSRQQSDAPYSSASRPSHTRDQTGAPYLGSSEVEIADASSTYRRALVTLELRRRFGGKASGVDGLDIVCGVAMRICERRKKGRKGSRNKWNHQSLYMSETTASSGRQGRRRGVFAVAGCSDQIVVRCRSVICEMARRHEKVERTTKEKYPNIGWTFGAALPSCPIIPIHLHPSHLALPRPLSLDHLRAWITAHSDWEIVSLTLVAATTSLLSLTPLTRGFDSIWDRRISDPDDTRPMRHHQPRRRRRCATDLGRRRPS